MDLHKGGKFIAGEFNGKFVLSVQDKRAMEAQGVSRRRRDLRATGKLICYLSPPDSGEEEEAAMQGLLREMSCISFTVN